MSGKKSRSKGCVGERELANLLKEMGFDAYRTAQRCGHAGDSDVQIDGVDLFIECKRYKDGIKIHTEQFEEWVTTCHRQCNGKLWLLFWRNDREPWNLTYMPKGQCFHMTLTGDSRIKQTLIALVHEIERIS